MVLQTLTAAKSVNAVDHAKRLPRLFYALGALNVLTVIALLVLGDQMATRFSNAVSINEMTARQIGEVGELQVQLSAINGPANNVFASHDVAMERELKDEAFIAYRAQYDRVFGLLDQYVLGEKAGHVRALRVELDGHVERLIQQADLTLLMYEQDNVRAAGLHMTLMDQAYADASDTLRMLVNRLGDTQTAQFETQRSDLTAIDRTMQGVILLVLLVVAGAIIYGQRLQNLIAAMNAARDAALAELRQREAALQDTLRQLRDSQDLARKMASVAEYTQNGVAILDLEGRATWINPAFERTSGWSREALLGQRLFSGLGGEKTKSDSLQEAARVLREGGSFVGEVVNYKPDGTPYWVSVDFRSIDDENGKPEFFITVGSDITERKNREAQLRIVSLVASHTKNEVAILDAQGLFVWANPALVAAIGKPLEELVGRPVTMFNRNETADAETRERLLAALRDKDAFNGETATRSADGSTRYNRLEIQPIFDSQGVHEYSVVVIADITTEKRQAEENRRLGLVAAHTQSGVVIYDNDGRYVWANQAYQRIFGLDMSLFYGKVSILFDPSRELMFEGQRRMRESFFTGNVFNGEVEYLSPHGEAKWLQVEQRPVFGSNGEIECWVNIANDVTETKRQAEENRRLSRVAEHTQSGVAIFDAEGHLEWTNKAYDAAVERDMKEFYGRKSPAFDLSREISAAFAPVRQAVLEKRAFMGELPDYTPSGALKWFQCEHLPVFGEDGEVECWLVVATDITEQKKQAEEVRRLSLVASSTENDVLILGRDRRIEWVNEAFCRRNHTTVQETVGKTLVDIRGAVQAAPTEGGRALLAALAAGEPFSGEVERYTSEGRPCWLRVEMQPIQAADGSIERFVVIGADISADKEQAEQLRRLSLVAAYTDNAVVISDAQGCIEWVNEGFMHLTGYTFDEVVGHKPGHLLQGEATDPAAVAEIRSALAAGRGCDVEIINYTKSGVPYWVRLQITPIRDAAGEIERFIAVESDISRQKQQAEASRQLALVAAHTHNAVLLLDCDRIVQWVNAGFTRLYGYTLQEVVGAPIGEKVIGPETDAEELARLAASLRSTESYRSDLLNYTKAGEKVWVSVDVTPVIGETGEVERYVIIIADISARKESEALVAQSLEKERQMNQQQRRFVSVVSHEFRTPLAIIDGAAQRLLRSIDRHDPNETLQRVGRIRGSVNRMTELIDTMLSTARLEEGRIEVKWQPVVLGELAAQIAERQRGVSAEFAFNLQVAEAMKPIEGDPKLLDQVLTNLLSNAVKYSGVSRTVDITAKASEDMLALSVRDYGIGIPQAELPKMFSRFFRASTSTGIPGTGIGLNLVKELVELHGGEIMLESIEGEGSTFTVRLPWRRPMLDEPKQSAAA
jgi:PAS domain S-box-containing protein